MKSIRCISVTLLLLLPALVFAQGTMLMRQPTISNTDIVFVYANDLWIVGKDGGDARRLTSNEGLESYPHFSPDGKWVAFTGQYDGNTDVYLIPTEGGQPQRLTWHPGADQVTGWTPDGESILFATSREGVLPTRESKIYTINKKGGAEEALPIPRAVAGEISEDGKYIAYQQIGFWDPEWRNHRGGQAKPIWIVDLKNFSLKMTPQPDNERHTDPVWLNNVVYFLSERDYANNVWSFNPANNELKQLTFHTDFDAKSIDAGGGQLVYEQGGYLHTLNPANGQTKKLVINVRGDFHWARARWEDVRATSLLNASLSPTGQRALFEYRGEIFTVPKEKGDWRNITKTSGAADRYPVWSPDGKRIAWFSDASGEYQMMITDQEGLEKPKVIAIPNPTFFFRPQWSPDGKYIAFTDTDYNLLYTDVTTGATKKVDAERYAHPNRTLNPVWSPDSKWIAYARLNDSQFKVIKAYNVETNQSLQLTDGMADAITPVWDASGKYLYFLASTNYALNIGWLDMTSYDRPVTRALYLIVLNKDDASPLLPRSDDEKEKPKDEKAGTPVVKIDLDGLAQRILAVDVPLRNYTELQPGPEGYVFYAEAIPNQQGATLHRYNFKDRKSEVYLTGINSASVSNDRKSLLYRSNATWGILGTTDNNKKVGDGKLDALASLKLKIEPREEWKQIFKEGWRYQRDFLYVNNTHGAPWNDVLKWYSPWVEHVQHRTDLLNVVDIMGGEIAVGHSYTRGGDFPDVKEVNIGLLGADYETDSKLYRIKKIYTGESWNPGLNAPLRGPGIGVKEGDYILEVNGVAVSASENLYKYFEGTANKQTRLRVNSKPSLEGSKLVTVVPVENENQLRMTNWVESNRKKVDDLSKGQLAYVYVPNTGQPGYTSFNRYYFSQQDRKGAIIDERNNGGGLAADYMVDVMSRQLHGYFNSKVGDHKPFLTPNAGIFGPKVMLINERAGSGGDLLPYMFNKMKIGPLVGTKTWGGLVGTWDTPPFVDGGIMIAPRGGFYDTDGKWAVEGVGISPDIAVEQTPADVIKGRDPQLERAVEEALKLVKTQALEIKPEPAPPIKYKRPAKKN